MEIPGLEIKILSWLVAISTKNYFIVNGIYQSSSLLNCKIPALKLLYSQKHAHCLKKYLQCAAHAVQRTCKLDEVNLITEKTKL